MTAQRTTEKGSSPRMGEQEKVASSAALFAGATKTTGASLGKNDRPNDPQMTQQPQQWWWQQQPGRDLFSATTHTILPTAAIGDTGADAARPFTFGRNNSQVRVSCCGRRTGVRARGGGGGSQGHEGLRFICDFS